MFKRISLRIALQFTAFVLLLFLVNGILFLAADLSNARRQTHFRLSRTSYNVLQEVEHSLPLIVPDRFQPPVRDRIRFVTASGETLFAGNFFTGVPFRPIEGFSSVHIQDDEYALLTVPVTRNDQVIAYVQIADMERLQLGDLPFRALLYFMVSITVSILTFIVGLFFARRSLKPAEEMVGRLEQFTQDASHELRTPLAALNSSLDLALKTGNHQEGILSAKQDVREITTLVERLLELARLDQFALADQKIDLSALVTQTAEKFKPVAKEKGMTLESTVKEGIRVRGDGTLIRQVLSNLVMNAIKFNKSGGTVRINLTKQALSVSDTGIGIKQTDLAHIFDRFFQADTSRAKDGLGLGLALVQRIVMLHGWTIAADSVEGQGTTFTIRIS